MNLKKAIADFIINDSDLNQLVGDRVYRNKATITDKTPLIVYSFDRTINKLGGWNNLHSYIGYNVIIDVIGKYEEQDTMEEIRNLLKQKLGGFRGELTGDWSGIISFTDLVDLYDDTTGLLVYRIEFLFKEIN